ncbi:hypothetical protein [Flammeovirga kamogawensis]|uniref:Uncharacterized protein n=1 Tax=Flammeovirga kamogawensis TaxID=373891 RepID=A0ABX8GXH5_9BACT|nr:hypothetical protein [Flammeovirga kamogawensis]MBB6463929.1 hypothetical protein [Flammeovirga kamogawensis]QWG08308.1 hypothetical protein KM029_05060 [Flammeovirga kamogawensis]TRX66604.1 hypothetical protein EO216_00125 [Flammeovirga kamogawensis]
MKHLILKKEIHLGYFSVVPEATKMTLSLHDIVGYMNFPANDFAKKVLENRINTQKGTPKNTSQLLVENNFNTKYSVDELLRAIGFQIKNETKDESLYLAEVQKHWNDLIESIEEDLMNVRYSLLNHVIQTNPTRLYQ